MDRYIRWDDRGSAFATWRVDPRVAGADIAWTGFRFCFVIEPSLEGDLGVFRSLDAHGATRRAQGFLPPWTQVLHFDVDGGVPPAAVLEVLASPYYNGVRDLGGRDINLCSRPALLASVMTPTLFARRCRDARTAAEAHIRSDAIFVARVEDATRAAERDGRRRARFGGDQTAAGGAAILDAVKSPRVRLDSMGFFVLSREPPARIS
jgi:ATP-dependent helicase HepA